MRSILLSLVSVSVLLAASPVSAQTYPTRAVRVIVPTSVGSGPDLIARVLGPKLSERWGQSVVIENKPGGGTVVGIAEAARSPGDGYTLVIVTDAFSSNPYLVKPYPFDPVKDIAPVIQIALGGMALAVNPSVPATTVAEFVAWAKKNPGKINFGSAGTGTTHHMMMEMFKRVAGIDLVHIPYPKGPGPMVIDLLEGRVSVAFVAANNVLTYVPTGKLRALGVAGDKRLSYAPDIPTVAETGYKAFNIELWYGLMAPGTTPPELVRKISADAAEVLAQGDVRERLLKMGIEAQPLGPAPFVEKLREDMANRAKLIREAGIKAE